MERMMDRLMRIVTVVLVAGLVAAVASSGVRADDPYRYWRW